MEGKVKFFNEEKGFGFITGEDGKEVFVHISGIEGNETLKDEQSVTYEVEEGDRGLKAVNVKIAEE